MRNKWGGGVVGEVTMRAKYGEKWKRVVWTIVKRSQWREKKEANMRISILTPAFS